MGEHLSYHQSITGEEAERRLKIYGQNGYLTRYSKSQKCYVLTIYRKQKPNDAFEHLHIIIKNNGKHKLRGREDEEFDSINSLLVYYKTHRISPGFPSIGNVYTEEEFNRQQDELDHQEIQRKEEENQELVHVCNGLREELQEARRELQAAEEQKQLELQAAEEQRHEAEAQWQQELQDAQDQIRELQMRPRREFHAACIIL